MFSRTWRRIIQVFSFCQFFPSPRMNDLILEAKILKHSSVFLCHFPYQPQKFSDALLLSTIEKEFQREGSCCVSLGSPWGPNLWDSIWLIWRASFLLSGWRLWGRRAGAQLFLRSPQRLNIPHSCPRGGCPVWRSPLPRRNPEAAVLCALPRCVVPLMSSTPPQRWSCFVFIYTGFFFPLKSSIVSILNYLWDFMHLNYGVW